MDMLVWIAVAALAILVLPYLGWAALSSRLRRIESHLRNEAGSHASNNELIAALTHRVWELESALRRAAPPQASDSAPPVVEQIVQQAARPAPSSSGMEQVESAPPLPGEIPIAHQSTFAEPAMPPPIPLAASVAAPVPHGQHLESRMGLTWVNRIGVITLIIGVGFFFKYAIDNEWIGETGRVILGVLAGFAAVAAGDVLSRRNQKVFAQGISGLGIAILYLSFYASFGFYHLLPPAAAFLLMAMVTAMAGALALRYEAMALAALGMLGGYATPILLSTGQDAPWIFFGYLFLLNVGAVAIARPRRWRMLDLMAFLATVILYASWFDEWFRPGKQGVATLAAFAFFATFAFAEWEWIFLAVQLLTALGLAAIWRDALPFLTLNLLAGAAGLILCDRARKPLAAVCSFGAFWGAYGLWQISNGKPAEIITIFGLLNIAFLMYLMWVPFQLLFRRAKLRTQHLTILAANGAAYFASAYSLLESRYHAWMGLLAAAVAGVHLLLAAELRKHPLQETAEGGDSRPMQLAMGVALAFTTLAVPIQFNGFSITLSWALEAAALVWIGRQINGRRVWFSAALVYLLVFVRLFVYDMGVAVEQPLLNVRFLTFAVSAVSFWLGAWWLKDAERPVAGAAYVTGHVLMLAACLMEFGDWAALSVNPGDRHSVMAIGISILMALYAVLLIAIGVARRSALDRILGLGLIGLVVLKLYLYDVWEASRLFRTAAFVALGLLLLLTSYLYSRFRPKIESWWKDEKAAS